MQILVGGVGQLYQGDLDLGRRAADILAAEDLGPGVVVEDLSYGAIAVAQRVEDLRPDALILVGAERRGRAPGTVERRVLSSEPSADAARAVAEAATGYVGIELLAEVGAGLGILPGRSVAIEVEPARTDPSDSLSETGHRALDEAVSMVRAEVRRTPLFDLADRLRRRSDDPGLEPSAALGALRRLLDDVARLEASGVWGPTFAARDDLRTSIADGLTGEGMDHLDWSLWWGLIEELDRLQMAEVRPERP